MTIWTEHIITTSLNFVLENLYYLAGIALFLVGISQVRSAIAIAKTKTERDAITVTVQQCEKFYQEIVPLVNEIQKLLEEYNFTFRNSKNLEMKRSEFEKYREITLSNTELLEKHLYITNVLDAFSTYFVEGVGNSEKAYNILGKTYCSSVRETIPIIIIGIDSGRFPSLRELYKTWNNKLESEKAESEYLKAKSNDKEHFKVYGL